MDNNVEEEMVGNSPQNTKNKDIQPNLFTFNRFKLAIAAILALFVIIGIKVGLKYAKEAGFEMIQELNNSDSINQIVKNTIFEQEFGESPDDTITYNIDDNCKQLIYVTYTKFNPLTGQTYAGKTQGCGNPADIVRQRDKYHHRNPEGFLPAIVDRFTYDYLVVRGREQQMIDYHGGAWSDSRKDGKTTKSANKIRAVSKQNKRGKKYHNAANLTYGEIAKYTGF